jgi:predicted methyltransferase
MPPLDVMSQSNETAAHLAGQLGQFVRNLQDSEEILRKVTAKPLVKERRQWHEERVDQACRSPEVCVAGIRLIESPPAQDTCR